MNRIRLERSIVRRRIGVSRLFVLSLLILPARFCIFREPERSEISTAAFRYSLTEVAWFVVAALALHWLDDVRQAVHASGWLALY